MFQKIKKHHTSGDYNGTGLICEYCDQRNSDKSDVIIYNSKYDISERVKKFLPHIVTLKLQIIEIRSRQWDSQD